MNEKFTPEELAQQQNPEILDLPLMEELETPMDERPTELTLNEPEVPPETEFLLTMAGFPVAEGFVGAEDLPEPEDLPELEALPTLVDLPEPDAAEEIPDADDEKMEFDLDAFLPEEEEDVTPQDMKPADETAPEPALSSGYMDNYPVLPDSVETDKTEEPVESFDDGGEFDAHFSKKDDEEEKRSSKERPTRKGRPKRKKGYGLLGIPHLIATVIWLLLIVAIGVSMGRMLWVCVADVLAFGREEKVVTVSVTTTDTMETIAAKLKDAGLVKYPELFLLYADLTDAQEKITTGSFTLNTVYDYHALVNQMSPRSGNRVVVEDVLIPEGYNCRQIFALLEQKGICKAADLEAWAASGELDDYWFLEGVQRGDKYCLEGFLFPDTYDFYENSTPKAALEKMLDGFDYRFTEELYATLPALNEHISDLMRKNGKDEAYIAAHQLDLRGLITVASLIEEETASATESYKIASVIYNRLYNWGNNPPYLNIDAALFYALGEHKNVLTGADKEVDSPYNTYRYQGLVPGPITNPGLDSIKAALDPENTNYYYYVLNPAVGTHDFSKTLDEHEKKVDKYLRGG